MTEGSISGKIILFAIPLFLGNLFQQLYNTADSLIVGNFLGSNALAAVSSSGNLIFLMVGFINGIAMGAGVVVARYYGAKIKDCLQKAIHTTVAFGLVAGVVLTVMGMFLAPKILVLMGTPADVLPESIVYFRTYFAGSIGVVMYNIFVGILQSVGDSHHPPDLSDHLFMHQCCTGYFFYCRSWYGCWFSCTGNSYFSVCQRHSLYDPPDACGRRISVRVENDPF